MPFRLRSDAIKWFADIDHVEPFKTDFDFYYLCLMAGLAGGRRTDPASIGVQANVFVNEFIQDYKPAQRLITGLLVTAELKREGINLSEKSAVRDTFKKLVAADTPTGMTDEGMKRLNAYASGGYEILSESRETRPTSSQEFLRHYIKTMGDLLA